MTARLLIVEDEESVAYAMRVFLQRAGYIIDVATELAQAKDAIAGPPYDLVISDLRLTGGQGAEGFELLTYLRARHPNARTILLTAFTSAETLGEAHARGASLVLKKPLPLRELKRSIEELIGSAA